MSPGELVRRLDERGVAYVVVRGGDALGGTPCAELRLLVRPHHVDTVREVAGELRWNAADPPAGVAAAWIINGDPRVPPLRVSVSSALRYGGATARLATCEPAHRILERRRLAEEGAWVAAPWDELVDLLLHCLLDLRDFPVEHRARIRRLMDALRSDPPAAGRAAERVEQELSPALPWSDLLADVVQERWDHLLACGKALERQLTRTPLSAARRALRGATGGLGRTRPKADPRAAAAPGRGSRTEAAGPADANGRGAGAPAEDVEPPAPPSPPPPSSHPSPETLTRKQIRGSGLLLAGRGMSTLLKFVAELIVVRYLATSEYGAWTYALSAVTALRGASALGLNRAISRYLPLHLERGEYREFYGVLAFVSGALLLAGAIIVSAFYAFPQGIAAVAGVASAEPLALLFIVIFLVPIETIDNALTGVCAAFGDSGTIFVRRYLLNPGLRIGIALLLVITQADVTLLAYGYLFAGLAGIAYYGWSVVTDLRGRGLLRLELFRGIRLPVRRVLSYTAPVAASDVCAVFMVTAGPLLLGYFTDMSTVALYQVVVPVAALNTQVFQSFAVLYEPSASRLYGRGDRPALQGFYWRSAVWVAVLTFPMFAMSFTAAEPLTVLFFGERYAAAAPILSLLAAAQFMDAMLGFNAATLRVSGKLRWLIGVNVLAVATNIGVSIALIPSLGALGAGIGSAVGYAVYTALKQVALHVATGVTAFDGAYRAPYVTMAVAAAALLAVRLLWADDPWIVVPAAVVASLAVYASARLSLRVSHTFPELGRSPLLRRILG